MDAMSWWWQLTIKELELAINDVDLCRLNLLQAGPENVAKAAELAYEAVIRCLLTHDKYLADVLCSTPGHDSEAFMRSARLGAKACEDLKALAEEILKRSGRS